MQEFLSSCLCLTITGFIKVYEVEADSVLNNPDYTQLVEIKNLYSLSKSAELNTGILPVSVRSGNQSGTVYTGYLHIYQAPRLVCCAVDDNRQIFC